jgi:cysteine desulfurase
LTAGDDADDDGFDMASLSAHKIHGPMGVGALYIRNGTDIVPLLHGGGHEREMRSGTLAVHNIVGFGKAAEMAAVSLLKDMPRLNACVDSLASDMSFRLEARRNGHPTVRLPNIYSGTIPGLDGSLACGLLCTKYGICVSAGSACGTKKRRSHVLAAMGKPESDVASTLRVSVSRYTRNEDMSMLVSRLQAVMLEQKKRSLI